ncbi:hypothetical protein HMPREF9374_3196 [Desmospora sp. 8437]|nr:hypothetical protein HMPREF9374_3196 [Desmospora sp. 8437]
MFPITHFEKDKRDLRRGVQEYDRQQPSSTPMDPFKFRDVSEETPVWKQRERIRKRPSFGDIK